MEEGNTDSPASKTSTSSTTIPPSSGAPKATGDETITAIAESQADANESSAGQLSSSTQNKRKARPSDTERLRAINLFEKRLREKMEEANTDSPASKPSTSSTTIPPSTGAPNATGEETITTVADSQAEKKMEVGNANRCKSSATSMGNASPPYNFLEEGEKRNTGNVELIDDNETPSGVFPTVGLEDSNKATLNEKKTAASLAATSYQQPSRIEYVPIDGPLPPIVDDPTTSADGKLKSEIVYQIYKSPHTSTGSLQSQNRTNEVSVMNEPASSTGSCQSQNETDEVSAASVDPAEIEAGDTFVSATVDTASNEPIDAAQINGESLTQSTYAMRMRAADAQRRKIVMFTVCLVVVLAIAGVVIGAVLSQEEYAHQNTQSPTSVPIPIKEVCVATPSQTNSIRFCVATAGECDGNIESCTCAMYKKIVGSDEITDVCNYCNTCSTPDVYDFDCTNIGLGKELCVEPPLQRRLRN